MFIDDPRSSAESAPPGRLARFRVIDRRHVHGHDQWLLQFAS
jgi:hypothetical protein